MDLDITFVLQFGIVSVLLVVLNGLLLKPFLRVIEERDQKIAGAKEESERLSKLGDQDMETYQKRMREARGRAQAETNALRDAGREEERRILGEVRAEIADSLNKARSEVAEAEAGARQKLSQDVKPLAGDIVKKVLGREVAA